MFSARTAPLHPANSSSLAIVGGCEKPVRLLPHRKHHGRSVGIQTAIHIRLALPALGPCAPVADHGIKQRFHHFQIAGHPCRRKYRMRRPAYVRAFPGHRSIREPEPGIVGDVPTVPKPSAFHDMVARRTVDRVVRSGPSHIRKKFGNDISFIGALAESASHCAAQSGLIDKATAIPTKTSRLVLISLYPLLFSLYPLPFTLYPLPFTLITAIQNSYSH